MQAVWIPGGELGSHMGGGATQGELDNRTLAVLDQTAFGLARTEAGRETAEQMMIKAGREGVRRQLMPLIEP